ncbi:MAG: hypothetical protein SGJ09_16105 [Phycisphaerae bacterium]|nr:hypothetical protein [Phycisphaerae bacterium]
MRILVDDLECTNDATTIAAALIVAANEAERQGRRVVEVAVDGEPWSESELGDDARLALRASELRCATVSPSHFLRETFLDAADELAKVDEMQTTAARALQADDTKRGMETLLGALAIWANIQKTASRGIEFGHIDPRSVTTSDGSFDDAAVDLNQRLTTLRDAMNHHDTVALSDCLMYEFPATTRRWSAILAELARRADSLMMTPAT